MITIADLQTSLLDLLHEMEGSEVKVIIGGGFGIYLKVVHVAQEGRRTLWREWPEPLSTNDLDLFLRPELLIESEKLKPLAEAIERLGYQAVAGAEKYQFVKPGAGGAHPGNVKIDILTGPQSRFNGTKVRADARRARPHPSIGIHANPDCLFWSTLRLAGISLPSPWQARKIALPLQYSAQSANPFVVLMGEDWFNREGSTMRANHMGAAVCMLAAAALLGGCAVADFGTVRPSADITRQFQDLEINPNYRYWYLNQENNPFGVLGLDREYHFEGGPMWGVLDPDTATFKKVVELVKNFPVKGSSTSGFEIMDSQGRPIGVWFSSLTAGINVDFAKKTVSVSTPTPWLRPYGMLLPERSAASLSSHRRISSPG